MASTTIIYAHPYDKSFNHAILERVQELLNVQNEPFQLINLYTDGFNPVYSQEELALFNQGKTLDPLILKYQKILKETDRLIFIFPIWWANVPAIVKGFFDKVFLKTFAYIENNSGSLKGLLSNIQETIVISTSTAPTFYLKYFCGNTIGKAMLGHTIKSIGVKKRRWINCGRANLVSQKKRTQFLTSLEKYI
ncbi:MAG: NAD(P)H-dependent oxidoreductase [Neisseria sp.]|uniref:NAD(P)H-dependent oxidoreductase n=1 Tax=Neisseria sp. TaxID=192066 RepID=UPI0026DC5D76|nr:NAD(P)H-dependent oxidoreductase [Neisseria sp.]MDO4640256.1 NAD(P)H-dependent oxidoreductase [Neisseria sp.]